MQSHPVDTPWNEVTRRTPERRRVDLVIDPGPQKVCVVSFDVAERHSAELALHHRQRMEVVGTLAGGIAHDFNNQLTAILGFTELLLQSLGDAAAQSRLKEIKNAAQRSAALTRQLLAFSRRRPLKIEPLDLNVVVSTVSELLQRLLPEDVTWQLELQPALPVILGDAQQLENVLTNLAVNARDAMPDGGRLTITTGAIEVTEEDLRRDPSMKPGMYALLTVTDTGGGMDDAIKAHVFEPFFTTKEVGKGTGLGLAMVYDVVQHMRGVIRFHSEPGRGTAFRLYFPATTQAVPPRQETIPAAQPRRQGTVLVVEDDKGVRDLIAQALAAHGYTVFAAASAEEAQRCAAHMPAPPDFVIVDVVLPDGSGPDLVTALDLRDAGVLFISGYSRKNIDDHRLEDNHLLEKPFSIRELLQAVDAAFHER